MRRHQVAVLRRQVRRLDLEPADRVVPAGLSQLLPRARWAAFLITPATLLRWHRDLIARRWTYRRRPPGRRPVTPDELTRLRSRLVEFTKRSRRPGCELLQYEPSWAMADGVADRPLPDRRHHRYGGRPGYPDAPAQASEVDGRRPVVPRPTLA